MTWSRKLALLVPLLLVNSMAVWGQGGWAYEHLTNANGWEDIAVAVLFAAAVESIGVYLSWEAHEALMADQAAGLLRAGSYGVGVLVGALNYAHFAAEEYGPTAQAVTFGLLSAISPWLWAIRSRSLNRDRLAELGMVDERGLKLSTARKFWHPVKALKVVRWAAWSGVTQPAAAVAGWEASRSGVVVDVSPLELAMAANAALSAALEADTDDDTDVPYEVVSAGADTGVDDEEVSDGSPDGTPSGVALQPADAKRIARALKAVEPDMSADMIAAVVRRSPRTVERYLNGHQSAGVS
jgi:hypothetical protein